MNKYSDRCPDKGPSPEKAEPFDDKMHQLSLLKRDDIFATKLGYKFSDKLCTNLHEIIDINPQNLASIDILSKNWEYPEIIRFRVSDVGTVNSLSSSKNITLMIDNDLPQLTLEAQIINEGELFNPVPLINYIYDNGTSFDSIDVTVTSGPNYNAQIISDTLYVDAPEDENWNGIELVNFEVTDAHPYDVKTLESQIEFIILPINDAPVLSNISNQTIEENDSLDLFLQVVDVDTGETLIFSASSNSSEIDFIINSVDSGRTFRGGKVNEELIKKSFFDV